MKHTAIMPLLLMVITLGGISTAGAQNNPNAAAIND
jgi:hypothetical protein